MPAYHIGLMSGTSLDGVDGVLADFSGSAPRVVCASSRAMPAALRAELLALNRSGPNELHRAAVAGQHLALLYAEVVEALLRSSGVGRQAVHAIGAHGQTVRHLPTPPAGGPCGYSVQLNQPALLAERTGICVVADFRSRDVAAGGQGAPLVPAFHRALFAQPGQTVAVVNIGGIANVSLLHADGRVTGFDTGPGNVLLDHWCHQHTGQAYDSGGDWGAGGQASDALLGDLLAEPYFARQGIKSTGRDLFHAAWLDTRLAAHPGLAPQDVQATLAQLTVHSVTDALRPHAPSRVLVCGGGAFNRVLMAGIQNGLPQTSCASTAALGWPVDQVEATAFAWLAWQLLKGAPGNLPEVTGALGPRLLGAIYPA
ncbi:anhydro-N-acetylmuramic acid kinase [Hydrogenophaga sp. OTU3427]|uniref:anhydro-N-acetylmuramic acid kinase n=1 Tax=Hydrogenophaga sp. OTU3427 TaxID=3043856 RepID=UPI00313B01F8